MILVTGANGLLGSKICEHLLDEGHRVYALVRKDSNTRLLDSIKDKLTIIQGDVMAPENFESDLTSLDTIIHCAAVVSFHRSDKELMREINVNGTANMVNLALRMNCKYFIQISSVAALGRKSGQQVVDESSEWEESDLNSHYGYSKYLAELEVYRGIAEGLNAVMLNPSVILSDAKSGRSSAQLIRYARKEPKFHPSGKINWVDIRDVLHAISVCLNQKPSAERYILNGGMVSYKDFFTEIATRLGTTPPKFEAGPALAYLGMYIQKVIGTFTGKKSLITSETIRLSKTDIYFDNEKAKTELGINFASLSDTLDWVCGTPQQ